MLFQFPLFLKSNSSTFDFIFFFNFEWFSEQCLINFFFYAVPELLSITIHAGGRPVTWLDETNRNWIFFFQNVLLNIGSIWQISILCKYIAISLIHLFNSTPDLLLKVMPILHTIYLRNLRFLRKLETVGPYRNKPSGAISFCNCPFCDILKKRW